MGVYRRLFQGAELRCTLRHSEKARSNEEKSEMKGWKGRKGRRDAGNAGADAVVAVGGL